MDRNFYKQFRKVSTLFIAAGFLVFSSCKKNAEAVNPGITYGITGIEPLMAGSGDTIKIYGVGFKAGNDGNTVKINGIDAEVVGATSEVLNVVVPLAPKTGRVTVQTNNQSNTFDQEFNLTTVLSGNQTASITLSPEKLYLLRGAVHMARGTVLTVQAGTIILAEKATHASLTIDDGAAIAVNGTTDKPVVFSSNQPIGLRSPGDWGGISLEASALPGTANDVLNYLRIEFAGYHLSNSPGAALLINRGTGSGKIANVQASYSGGDGFRCNAGNGTVEYLKYLVALGCAGNDFDFAGDSRVVAQFLVGVKNPLYADQFGADGLLVQSSQPVTISNLTLMGPNGLARNAVINQPNYDYYLNYDDILNPRAGRGVHIGGTDPTNGQQKNGTLQLFNSVVAASWLAGVSVDGAQAWAKYGNGSDGSVIKYSSFTYTLATASTTLNHDVPPLRGYIFSPENLRNTTSGFQSSAKTAQGADFNASNDSLKLQLTTPFLAGTNPYATYDELGIANMALYSKISSPLMVPATGSLLLSGAIFSDSQLTDSFIDKTQKFRGAFGAVDWTRSWCNFAPQQTPYK